MSEELIQSEIANILEMETPDQRIYRLRLEAEHDWMELLVSLGRMTEDDSDGHAKFYSDLFRALFDRGPIELDPDLKLILGANIGQPLDKNIELLFVKAKKALLAYLSTNGTVTSEEDFIRHHEPLVLYVATFGYIEQLTGLQSHIQKLRESTHGKVEARLAS